MCIATAKISWLIHVSPQAAETETKKYEEAQQSEQSAFQASIVDLNHAVASMQSYTDMSAATAVAQEVLTAHLN